MAKKDTFWESIYKFKNKLMAVFTILVIFGSIIGYLSTQVTTLVDSYVSDSASFKKLKKKVKRHKH